jgi:predicted signal transduction protein with EAL and GGDEF domain
LLVGLSERLKEVVRSVDIAARISGDEFVLLLENIETERNVETVIQKLQHVVKKSFHIQQQEVRITLSMGVAMYPDDGSDVQLLMSHADAAMYFAKQTGRNNYQFYTDKLTQAAMDHLRISNALQEAIENNTLSLVFQPQPDTTLTKITGMEALLRWHHPELGAISPARFVPIAEQAGLMRDIGQWVLVEACQNAKRLLDLGHHFGKLAVNIAGAQITDGCLIENVKRALNQAQLPPQYLALEVTESFVMRHVDKSIQQLSDLRALGVDIHIDDFGTGHSSLSYLKQLPIDKLKIDQSFIRDIPTDPDDMAITKAIVSMAKALNLEVIAEGVENQAQLSYLSDIFCTEIQGFYFSKPLDFSHLGEFIEHMDSDPEPA